VLKRLEKWGLILLFCLCVMDASYTIYFVKIANGKELNPAASYFLSLSPTIFLMWKIGLSLVCCLLFHVAFKLIRARWVHFALLALIFTYSVLAAYHVATFLIVCP